MFGLLTRRNKKVSTVRPQAKRLGLEELERRDVPSTLTLHVSYGTDTNVNLCGYLTDSPNVAGQTIDITGMANGSATTDATGHFKVTLQASGLGEVDAQTDDGQSNLASVILTDPGPSITSFTASEGPNDVWEFSGTISYGRSFTTMTVNFGGDPVSIQNQSTTAGSDGSFDLTLQLNGTASDNGDVWAQAIDAWGTASNQANNSVFQTGTGGTGLGGIGSWSSGNSGGLGG